MLKELLYTGLGATVVLKEKVDEELKKLEEKGKIDSSDIKGFIESLENKGKKQDEEMKGKFKEQIKEIIDELGLVTKKDLEDFKKEL